MIDELRLKNSTSVRIRLYVKNSSTGQGLTGLGFSSAGLVISYFRDGDTDATQITLVSGIPGTWSSGGFSEIDSVKSPGLYELGLPNAALAVLGKVDIVAFGATNMASTPYTVQVVNFDPTDGNALGLAYLSNVNTQAAKLQFDGSNNVKSTPQTAVTVTGSVTVGAYAAGQDPGSLVLATPANKLATDSSGRIILQPSGADAIVIETGLNLRQAVSICTSALAGVLSGAQGPSVQIAAANAPTVTRIVATVDSLNNRTSITLTPPA